MPVVQSRSFKAFFAEKRHPSHIAQKCKLVLNSSLASLKTKAEQINTRFSSKQSGLWWGTRVDYGEEVRLEDCADLCAEDTFCRPRPVHPLIVGTGPDERKSKLNVFSGIITTAFSPGIVTTAFSPIKVAEEAAFTSLGPRLISPISPIREHGVCVSQNQDVEPDAGSTDASYHPNQAVKHSPAAVHRQDSDSQKERSVRKKQNDKIHKYLVRRTSEASTKFKPVNTNSLHTKNAHQSGERSKSAHRHGSNRYPKSAAKRSNIESHSFQFPGTRARRRQAQMGGIVTPPAGASSIYWKARVESPEHFGDMSSPVTVEEPDIRETPGIEQQMKLINGDVWSGKVNDLDMGGKVPEEGASWMDKVPTGTGTLRHADGSFWTGTVLRGNHESRHGHAWVWLGPKSERNLPKVGTHGTMLYPWQGAVWSGMVSRPENNGKRRVFSGRCELLGTGGKIVWPNVTRSLLHGEGHRHAPTQKYWEGVTTLLSGRPASFEGRSSFRTAMHYESGDIWYGSVDPETCKPSGRGKMVYAKHRGGDGLFWLGLVVEVTSSGAVMGSGTLYATINPHASDASDADEPLEPDLEQKKASRRKAGKAVRKRSPTVVHINGKNATVKHRGKIYVMMGMPVATQTKSPLGNRVFSGRRRDRTRNKLKGMSSLKNQITSNRARAKRVPTQR